MKTTYTRGFFKPSGSNVADVKMDRILRSTLNSNFNKDAKPESEMDFDLTQNVDEDSKPYAHQYDKSPKKIKKQRGSETMRKTQSPSINEPCGVNYNFHQTQLDVFPFRNTQKVRNQSHAPGQTFQSAKQMKDSLKQG